LTPFIFFVFSNWIPEFIITLISVVAEMNRFRMHPPALSEVISDLLQYFSSSAKPAAHLGPKRVIEKMRHTQHTARSITHPSPPPPHRILLRP
jgi:hypothetical protein